VASKEGILGKRDEIAHSGKSVKFNKKKKKKKKKKKYRYNH